MITKTIYTCEICEEEYDDAKRCEACERIPASEPKYKYGNFVTIATGEGAGEKAQITRVFYLKPSWRGIRYAHRVAYHVDMIQSWGSRQLVEGESVL